MSSKFIKYPRTMHLPNSKGLTTDDKYIKTLDGFVGRQVVITEKMDGENTTLYCDGLHARSMDSRHHPSRDWIKSFWSQMGYKIPKGWRVCGENLYAQHSIKYDNLQSYFYGFSIWNDRNVALSWDDTLRWFDRLGINPVPVLYVGEFDADVIEKLAKNMNTSSKEGFVIRVKGSIPYEEFDKKVAKWVRANHVQANSSHWMHSQLKPNKLIDK